MATQTQEQLRSSDSDYEVAMARAGRMLTLRARTEKELIDRLEQAGFEQAVVAAVLARLRELSLVDDAAFARSWIEERTRRKASGPVLLADELRAKGIDESLVAEVIGDAFPDESARAAEVAAGLIGKWSHLPLPQQAARLAAALGRKGFSTDAIEAAVASALPPEGWD